MSVSRRRFTQEVKDELCREVIPSADPDALPNPKGRRTHTTTW